MVNYFVIGVYLYDIVVLWGSDTMNTYTVLWCMMSCLDRECVKDNSVYMWSLSMGNNLWRFQCNNMERMQRLLLVMLWNLYPLYVVKCSQCLYAMQPMLLRQGMACASKIAQSTGFEMGNPLWMGWWRSYMEFLQCNCAAHVGDGATEVNNIFHKIHNMVPTLLYKVHDCNWTVWITQVFYCIGIITCHCSLGLKSNDRFDYVDCSWNNSYPCC